MPLIPDQTLPLLLEGYGWLPNRRRRSPDGVVGCRLLGKPAVGLCGPDAARFCYDEEHVRRHGALPEPVLSTLFGHGAVHTLDGAPHRVRKAMFVSLATDGDVAGLVDRVGAAWDDAVKSWRDQASVVLFDEASRVITQGLCEWTGIPLPAEEVPAFAADLIAMVDGFATLGPRHRRARRARQRREAWLARLIEDARSGAAPVARGSAVDVVARHRDADGAPLEPRVAAVELLNIVRPSVAVSWFLAFAGHALYRWPEHRERLRAADSPDAGYAAAFAQEVRRFYPFAPFVGGTAVRDLSWRGHHVPAGALVLLDLYGQDHDPDLWPDPYRFDPDRFGPDRYDPYREAGEYRLIPQGGGDPRTGHRCPGERIVVGLLRDLSVRLARLDHRVPPQDLTIALHRIPARPASGFVLAVGR